ncbi:MAG: helix-turn-helix transcriptional regulator [Cytophagales bacterium]|nr:helix-turn-helix transcriptional regulator [Cytophagales bacterium]
MTENIHRNETLADLHASLGYPKPKHPLISLLDTSQLEVPASAVGRRSASNLYLISIKDKNCGVDYGRNSFDFNEGVMVFSAPGQVYTNRREVNRGDIQGWMLYFHPDLIRNTHLGSIIDQYSFFNYDVFEALHLSEEEEQRVNICLENIKSEYEQRIDNHSQRVIVSNLELLLNYALRFYERQFNTRTNQSKDVVAQFERSLKRYYRENKALNQGVPSIQDFAEEANLSQHYFSDLIKKETGRSPKDHINEHIVEQAKNKLMGSELSISEIAYDLGFNYPHYFTRLFKSKTGQTPVEYRNGN